MHRTHTCGELRKSDVGSVITLAGWVNKRRDLGGMIFIDLRDRYGLTQITLDPQRVSDDIMNRASDVSHEWVIKIEGEVVARPEEMVNDDMDTGTIEVVASDLIVLGKSKELPFMIVDDPATSEEQRLKHRYLDLRRRPVLKNIEFKAKMTHFTRNWFTDAGFLEVQTPIFTVSSPEGARDYLIPSRVNPGKFYAMPQAPQQYKQLLMVGGIDKYFQIAPCFRDEDPRADRHSCEFYQIDAEMSFVEQEDVFNVCEAYSHALVKELVPHKEVTIDFQRLSYADAMRLYGSDKPDLRFGMKIVDLTEELRESDFGVFSKTIADGGVTRAIRLEGQSMTRKELDALTEVAKHAGAGGLAYLIFEEGGVRSPIAKFLKEDEIATIQQKLGATDGDIIFFGADKEHTVCKVLNKVRLSLRDKYDLADNNHLAFAWIIDFPFYEHDEKNDSRDFGHNPFSHIVGGVEALKTKDFADIETNQYDMVLNGYEILSGSIRNHDPKVMVAAFEKLGLTEATIKEKFGAMYEAFQYGCPPHGGFAFGFDRLMMILCDETNIRECYAFPKSGRAEDVMMGAPSRIDQTQLKDLHIDIVEKE